MVNDGAPREPKKGLGLGKTIGLALALLVGGYMAKVMYANQKYDEEAQKRATEVQKRAAEAAKLILPAAGIDARQVLAQPRAVARATLGAVSRSESTPEVVDWFKKPPVDITVVYEGGKAIELALIAPGSVRMDADAVSAALKWMGLDPNGAAPGIVTLTGVKYRVMPGAASVRVVDDARLAAKEAKAAAARLSEMRKQLAAGVEEGLLKQGQNVRVSVLDGGKTLWIEWVLCNRATMTQLLDGGGRGSGADHEHAIFQKSLKMAGFTQVKCLDPFSQAGVAWKL
jgi:cell division septum initiation protein DivIVA